MKLRGIDVSRFNPPDKDPLDGVDFIAARATSGLGLDPTAGEHLTRAFSRAVPVPVGILYGWVSANLSAEEQAALYLGAVSRLESDLGESIGLAVDAEDPPNAVFPREGYLATAAQWVRLVSGARGGQLPLLYGSRGLLEQWARIAMREEASEWPRTAAADWATLVACPLWLASYTVPHEVPGPWTRATILQTGPRAGVDRDESELSLDELRRALGLEMDLPTPRR